MESFTHPKSIINIKQKAKQLFDDQLIHMGALYLQEQALQQPNCVCITKRTLKGCDCLRIFTELTYDYCLTVSRYMVKFAKPPKAEQQMTVIEWIRYLGVNEGQSGRLFIVPQWKTKDNVNRFLDDTQRPLYN